MIDDYGTHKITIITVILDLVEFERVSRERLTIIFWIAHRTIHSLQFNSCSKLRTYSIRHRKRFHYYKQTTIYFKSISEKLIIYNEIKYIYFHNISNIQTYFNHIIFTNIYYAQQCIISCKCFIRLYL